MKFTHWFQVSSLFHVLFRINLDPQYVTCIYIELSYKTKPVLAVTHAGRTYADCKSTISGLNKKQLQLMHNVHSDS